MCITYPKYLGMWGKKVYRKISSGSCFFGHFQDGRHQNYAKNGENRFFVIVTLKLFQNGCNLVFWRVFYVLLGCHFHFCRKKISLAKIDNFRSKFAQKYFHLGQLSYICQHVLQNIHKNLHQK